MAQLDPSLLMILIFIAVIAMLTLLAYMFGIIGKSDKALNKKLETIKSRQNKTRAMQTARKKLFVKHEQSMLDKIIPKPEEMRKKLQRTGRDITVKKYALASIAVAFGVAITIKIVTGLDLLPCIVVGIFSGLFLPQIAINKIIDKRATAFTKQFPEAIDLMVRGLKAGLPIFESFNAVAQEMDPPISQYFQAICSDVKMGTTLSEALQKTSDQVNTADFDFFVISLNIQHETGGNIAETLGNLSTILRGRSQLKLKIRAMSSEGRASATIIGILPFAVALIIHLSNPEYLAIMFTDPRGQIGLVVAMVMLSSGMWVISKMIDFEI